jgi:glycosyltransferase involved in cell wall biosynthesis
MKILLVTSFFPPTRTAGTEILTFKYAQTLLARGYQVQVLCAGDWENGRRYWNGYQDEIYQNIPVRRINLNWNKSPNPNAYLYNNPRVQQHLQDWLNHWKPDLVHITSCITLSASVITSVKMLGLPVVLTLTDFWFICPRINLLKYDKTLCSGITTSQECIRCLLWDSNIYRKLVNESGDAFATWVFEENSKIPIINRQRGLRGMALNIGQRKKYLKDILNYINNIIAPSAHLREIIQQNGIQRDIQVIQYGHDLTWLEGFSKTPSGKKVRFGYIGQIIPAKGIHILLEAYGLHKNNGRSELHIYGNYQADFVYYQQLLAIKEKLPVSIYFHGPFSHEKLPEILAEIDVLIVPSLWHENNPLVIQEAFASKTPVIASNVGGIAEYIQHGVNGFLFERGNSSDLRIQIEQLANDPQKIERIKALIPKVKSIQEEMDEYEMIYHRLIHQFSEQI